MKIGITERGDPSIDFSWVEQMEKMDVIKFTKAQIDVEMAKLKDAKDDDLYAQGKILAYTDVTRMLLEACLDDYVEGTNNKE